MSSMLILDSRDCSSALAGAITLTKTLVFRGHTVCRIFLSIIPCLMLLWMAGHGFGFFLCSKSDYASLEDNTASFPGLLRVYVTCVCRVDFCLLEESRSGCTYLQRGTIPEKPTSQPSSCHKTSHTSRSTTRPYSAYASDDHFSRKLPNMTWIFVPYWHKTSLTASLDQVVLSSESYRYVDSSTLCMITRYVP